MQKFRAQWMPSSRRCAIDTAPCSARRVSIGAEIFTRRGRSRMAKQSAVRTAVDLEPIDRLEEKIKLLVGIVTQLRDEQARAAEDNARLTQEISTLRARLADAEGADEEIVTLRGERELIRNRVSDMLSQLEGLAV